MPMRLKVPSSESDRSYPRQQYPRHNPYSSCQMSLVDRIVVTAESSHSIKLSANRHFTALFFHVQTFL